MDGGIRGRLRIGNTEIENQIDVLAETKQMRQCSTHKLAFLTSGAMIVLPCCQGSACLPAALSLASAADPALCVSPA